MKGTPQETIRKGSQNIKKNKTTRPLNWLEQITQGNYRARHVLFATEKLRKKPALSMAWGPSPVLCPQPICPGVDKAQGQGKSRAPGRWRGRGRGWAVAGRASVTPRPPAPTWCGMLTSATQTLPGRSKRGQTIAPRWPQLLWKSLGVGVGVPLPLRLSPARQRLPNLACTPSYQ